jgi:hypothetical protein
VAVQGAGDAGYCGGGAEGMMNSTDPFPTTLFVIFFAFILSLNLYWFIAMQRRTRAIKLLAPKLGLLPWPNDSLPRDLFLSSTQFANWSKLSNVYSGIINGVEVAFFDCKVGRGKGSWTRTIIAVRSNGDVFGAKAFDLDFNSQRCEEWLLLYRRREGFRITPGVMPVSQIESHIRNIQPKQA